MKRIFTIALCVIPLGLVATGCSYPSDTEQQSSLKSAGFTCEMTGSSDFWNNAKGLCDYQSIKGTPCKAQVEVSDNGYVVVIKRAYCDVDSTPKK